MLSQFQTVIFRRIAGHQHQLYSLPFINIQKRGLKTKRRIPEEIKPPGTVLLERTFNTQTPDRNLSYITHTQLEGLLQNNNNNNNNNKNQKLVIIDVRNEWELEVEPTIRGSINVPVEPPPTLQKPKKKKVEKKKGKGKPNQKKDEEKTEEAPQDLFRDAYFLPIEKWQSRFKKPKPEFEDNVVLVSSTHDDKRSLKVYQSATQLGFSKSKLLVGGIRVWNKFHNNEDTKKNVTASGSQ